MCILVTIWQWAGQNAATIISISSLIFAFVTLYKSILKPFKLEGKNLNRCVLSMNVYGMSPNILQMGIGVDLLFYNSGAQAGIVENLAIKFRTENREFLLVPRVIVLDRVLNTDPREKRAPRVETFSAFTLGANEYKEKRIQFVPRQADEEFPAIPGDYKLEVLVKTSKGWSRKNGWMKADRFDLTILKDDAEKIIIQSGTVGETLVLFQEKLINEKDFDNI